MVYMEGRKVAELDARYSIEHPSCLTRCERPPQRNASQLGFAAKSSGVGPDDAGGLFDHILDDNLGRKNIVNHSRNGPDWERPRLERLLRMFFELVFVWNDPTGE